MVDWKSMAVLAACAALTCSDIASAAGPGAAADEPLLRPSYLQDATATPSTEPASQPTPPPAPPKPLMALLDSLGVGKPLEDLNITIGGFVEGGYTIAAEGHGASNTVLAGRFFDTKNNKVVLDQIDFFIDRPVDYAAAAQKHTFDIGGHVEAVYGWDTGLFHSSGLFDNPATLGVINGYYTSRTHPENQFDIVQAYLDFALPVGSGLRIRAGKFVTLLGYELINPTQNAFYSHSYMFSFAIPLTQTGVLGEYKLSDDFMLDAGITRGWSQTFNDNNGSPDFLGGITFTPQESDTLKKFKFILNLSEGPQGTHDSGDWWTVLDFQAIFTASEKLTLALNADYGDAPHVPGVVGAPQWYGIAGYAAYVLNDNFTPNVRVEYYGDNKGFTLGAAGLQNLYEATLNVDVKPFPADPIGSNLVIRPEVRYDYSDKNFFKSATRHSQLTFGVDAYFTF